MLFVGILYLVSTPIGNLEDISLRAAKTLRKVDLILCEDTRKAGRLLEWIRSSEELCLAEQSRPELLSYTDYTRDKRMDEVLARLARGQNVALISNAGTPLLSDPGFKLVQEVIKASADFAVQVEALPGANAILPALQLSGLPPDKFIFLGFLPKKAGQRRELLEHMGSFGPTIIAFESPRRLLATLEDICAISEETAVAICRELTKMHEEVFRGSVSAALEHFRSQGVRGEATIVFRFPD